MGATPAPVVPGPYSVTNVRIRQSPRLDMNGQPYTATIATFYVGANGPFTLTFLPGQGTPQAIIDGITATVNQLIAQDQAIGLLNQQTATK